MDRNDRLNYRRFIPHYSRLSKCLRDLTLDDATFEWEQKHEVAFKALKQILTQAPVLMHPDMTKPFKLTTDASNEGISGVLHQIGEGGKVNPVFFASRSLTKLERNYSATELELLAIIYCCELFRNFLLPMPFELETDHSALIWLFKQVGPARLNRWILRLSEFDFTIKHKKGVTNWVADALSRAALKDIEPYGILKNAVEALYLIGARP